MNKLVKKLVSVSLGCAAVFGATQISSFASPIAEASSILIVCHGKKLAKKIKKIKDKIKDNEKHIKRLEGEKLELETKIAAKRSTCKRLNLEINACPYCNCDECLSLYSKVKNLEGSIAVLKSELKTKKYQIKLAKEERERLDGKLAVLLQAQELKKLDL